MTRKSGPRPRRVPQRTCVACRQEQGKRELVRIVRTVAGPVEVDPRGRKPGRGAYLCRNRACWEQALRRGTIEHALKTTLSPADRAALVAFAATMPLKSVVSTRAAEDSSGDSAVEIRDNELT
ncbi:MAG: YlxR family protein [Chloroflexi bacterium]|nr:YlxR family protein [Chloroflexota bacterium]